MSIIIFAFEVFDILMYSLILKSRALNILKVFLSVCTNAYAGQGCRVTFVMQNISSQILLRWMFSAVYCCLSSHPFQELQAPKMLRATAFSSNCITSTHQAKEPGMSVLLHTITSSLPISVLRSNILLPATQHEEQRSRVRRHKNIPQNIRQ